MNFRDFLTFCSTYNSLVFCRIVKIFQQQIKLAAYISCIKFHEYIFLFLISLNKSYVFNTQITRWLFEGSI